VLSAFSYARHVRVKTLDVVIEKAAGNAVGLGRRLPGPTSTSGPFLKTPRLEKIVNSSNALDLI